MTIGMGTPSSKSKIERMVKSPRLNLQSNNQYLSNRLRNAIGVRNTLDGHNMIPLPASDGRGEARAKRTYQESKECPEQ